MRTLRTTTRTTALGVVTAGLLVATAACSDSSGEAPGARAEEGSARSQSTVVEALQATAKKSQEARTATFESVTTMDVMGMDGIEMSVSGTIGWQPLAMDASADMNGFMQALLDMFGELAAEDPEASGELDRLAAVDATMNMRLVDNVMYMSGPMMEPALGGKTWVKVDLAEAAAAEGDPALGQMLDQLNSASYSPATQVALMLESPEVEWKGEESLDGVTVNRYEGTLTAEELLAMDPSTEFLSEEELDLMRSELATSGSEEYLLSVWVDENDYPVRIDMTVEMPEGSMVQSTRYGDYGEAPAVEHPPAGEVVDSAELEDGIDPFGFGGLEPQGPGA
ncbi:hypothetical protein [Streptomyces aidingensis]|uniref:Lipoprotein n=1 Tax=Streptomyces aidingensis TaxID=910347 RepID=A0A1I1E4K8_9ACTN|nr:hypothetical protein [Streptomyces aidingensis]SFB82165.1 hypothetical protein SAMN05421773_101133 [Streptomyces aidingensis]